MRVPIRLKLVATACGAIVLALTVLAGASSASAQGTPKWQITTFATPTSFTPEGEGVRDLLNIFVSNVGGAPTNGTPVTVKATLAPGVGGAFKNPQDELEYWSCGGLTCTSEHVVTPMEQQGEASIRLLEFVGPSVPVGSDITTTLTVSGGGSPVTSETVTTEVRSPLTPPPFGLASLSGTVTNLDGEPDTQAADHPNGLITGFGVSTEQLTNPYKEVQYIPVQSWKDIVGDLPPGVVANPQVVPQCTFTQLLGADSILSNEPIPSYCPPASQIAKMDLEVHGGFTGLNTGIDVYNMVPEGNEPAEFAFNLGGVPLSLYPTVVGNGAGAHIRVTTPGIPVSSFIHLGAVAFKFFGDPNEQAGGRRVYRMRSSRTRATVRAARWYRNCTSTPTRNRGAGSRTART